MLTPFDLPCLTSRSCCLGDYPHLKRHSATYLSVHVLLCRTRPSRAKPPTQKSAGGLGSSSPSARCWVPASKSSIAAAGVAALAAARGGVGIVGGRLLLHERQLLRRLDLQVVEGAYGVEERGEGGSDVEPMGK